VYKDLADGQSPKTLILSCSDSRVDPSIITDANPGDIFVIRNVANLVPPCQDSNNTYHGVSAALEFGVKVLKVNHIVVVGHSGCAGIRTLVETDSDEKNFDYVNDWVKIAKEAKAKSLSQDAEPATTCCEKEAVLVSLSNLLSFPWIKERVESQDLKLWGWYFSVKDGSLSEYDPNVEKFVKLETD